MKYHRHVTDQILTSSPGKLFVWSTPLYRPHCILIIGKKRDTIFDDADNRTYILQLQTVYAQTTISFGTRSKSAAFSEISYKC